MSYGVGMAYQLSVYIVQNVHCTIMFLQTLTAKVCIRRVGWGYINKFIMQCILYSTGISQYTFMVRKL